MKIELLKLVETLKEKGYLVFTDPMRPNIVGIRSSSDIPDKFDDLIVLFYTTRERQVACHIFPATTDPGLYYLENPMNVEGTAILAPGQYVNAFKLGMHKGQYKCLVQRLPVKIIRDFNRDNKLDFDSEKVVEEMAGIELHYAGKNSKKVGKWSGGCQVTQDEHGCESIVNVCEQSAQLYGNAVTYTLITEEDLQAKTLNEIEAKGPDAVKKTKKGNNKKGESEDGQ